MRIGRILCALLEQLDRLGRIAARRFQRELGFGRRFRLAFEDRLHRRVIDERCAFGHDGRLRLPGEGRGQLRHVGRVSGDEIPVLLNGLFGITAVLFELVEEVPRERGVIARARDFLRPPLHHGHFRGLLGAEGIIEPREAFHDIAGKRAVPLRRELIRDVFHVPHRHAIFVDLRRVLEHGAQVGLELLRLLHVGELRAFERIACLQALLLELLRLGLLNLLRDLRDRLPEPAPQLRADLSAAAFGIRLLLAGAQQQIRDRETRLKNRRRGVRDVLRHQAP